MKEKINLLFTGNDYAFDGILISLLSITKYTKAPLDVYIFTMKLDDLAEKGNPIDDSHKKVLEEVLRKANKESKVILVDVKDLFTKCLQNSANRDNKYTPYAQIRLLAHEVDILPDKVLYLDADTVASNDITELYNIDIENYEYAGVKDHYGKVFINPRYINTGVLLLNMKMIRETGLFAKSIDYMQTHKLGFPDQSAINKCTTKKLLIDHKYNDQKRLHKDTVIRHFAKTIVWFPIFHTRNIKPWKIDMMHKYKVHWCDDILDEYKKIKEDFKKENSQEKENISSN